MMHTSHARVVAVVALVLAASACTHPPPRTLPGARPPVTDAAGFEGTRLARATAALVVSNRTSWMVDVYMDRGGSRSLLGEIGPGRDATFRELPAGPALDLIAVAREHGRSVTLRRVRLRADETRRWVLDRGEQWL
jgi:hypothetical protein